MHFNIEFVFAFERLAHFKANESFFSKYTVFCSFFGIRVQYNEKTEKAHKHLATK